MYCWRNPYLIKLTLFFFVFLVCYSPAYAEQQIQNYRSDVSFQTYNIPVAYVSQAQADQIFWESQQRGFTVQQGTRQQLAELEQGVQKSKPEINKENPCSQKSSQKNSEKTVAPKNDNGSTVKGNKTPSKDCTTSSDKKSQKKNSKATDSGAIAVPIPDPAPPLEPLPPPQAEPPQPTVHTNVGVYADVSYGSGRGSNGDFGKVFFIVAGIMVIAAFIVYAGKYISDLASGKEFKTWWEFIFSSTYLSTRSGQHGRLNGLKIATGFVSSDLIQVALVGEFGQTNIDLVLDEYSINSASLDFSASYWLLGATARMHLTNKLINASYLYLDFMGGKTSNNATDTIGLARFGASFGVNDYVRLGASIGAYYIGLDDKQGFANNGDNYWTTFGFEMGVKF